jgi:hypothetical protein
MQGIGLITMWGSKSTTVVAVAAVIVLPALAWQTHRVGTKGPETPPLQGAGRWHYLAPLPHARSEVAVAEANGKVYVLAGYADGFVDQPLNEEYDPVTNTWRERARPVAQGVTLTQQPHPQRCQALQSAQHLLNGDVDLVAQRGYADGSSAGTYRIAYLI